MTIIPHVIAGAAAGSFFSNTPLALGAGLFSHFVLDLIPHWDPSWNGKVNNAKWTNPLRWKKIVYPALLGVDIGLGLILLLILSPFPTAFMGGLIGGLIDLDNILHWLSKLGLKVHEGRSGWHHSTGFLPGVLTQVAVTLIGLYVLYNQLNLH